MSAQTGDKGLGFVRNPKRGVFKTVRTCYILPTKKTSVSKHALTAGTAAKAISLATNNSDINVNVSNADPPLPGQQLIATGPPPSMAATWQYSNLRNSVRAATIVAGTLATDFADGQSIDGVLLVEGDRILIKNQANLAENGIYVVTSEAPVRADDYSYGTPVAATFMVVQQGGTQADTLWLCTADKGSDVVGTNNLMYTEISGGGGGGGGGKAFTYPISIVAAQPDSDTVFKPVGYFAWFQTFHGTYNTPGRLIVRAAVAPGMGAPVLQVRLVFVNNATQTVNTNFAAVGTNLLTGVGVAVGVATLTATYTAMFSVMNPTEDGQIALLIKQNNGSSGVRPRLLGAVLEFMTS